MASSYQPIYQNAPKDFGRVLVLYGGQSSEREISLQSGERVFEALQNLDFDVQKLDMNQDVIADLQSIKPDFVFIALHGAGGEDGKIQAVLEHLSIPYTGSGYAASALAMDKARSKQIWQSLGLPTPDFVKIENESNIESERNWQEILDRLGGDVFVKPDHEGSSIGMSTASSAEELQKAYELARGFKGAVLAEKRIKGAEYTVAILGDYVLPPIQLKAKSTFYDYDAKYLSDETEYLCPCGLSEQKEAELKAVCHRAFKAIGCEDWARVDVMADDDENFYLLEVNTVPGMTTHSLVPMAARQAGLGFDQLVAEILALAVKQQR